jgi:outer membrane murein-binding lipoprotein Lpp
MNSSKEPLKKDEKKLATEAKAAPSEASKVKNNLLDEPSKNAKPSSGGAD